MSLVINTNVASLNARRQLQKSTDGLATTFKRLSSGLRVNSARDDAAGLSISTKMNAQVRGLNQAQRNANDGISLMQVAEGAMDETVSSLQRIRELAVQSANGTYTSADRVTMDKEVMALMEEVDRIANQTQFNGMTLLSGNFSAKAFQVGSDAGQTVDVSIVASVAGGTASGMTVNGLGLSGAAPASVSTTAGAASMMTKIDNALTAVSQVRSRLGTLQNRFASAAESLANVSENTSASNSRIVDADIAQETAQLTRHSILQQAGTAILAQANQQPQLALQLLGR